MELRSGRPLTRSPAADGDRPRRRHGRPDHLSALPDDLLLEVLARIRCTRTAVRTGLLSRRWRGLWRTTLTDLLFRDVAPATFVAALACFAASPTPAAAVSTINICFRSDDALYANSLLRAAAPFSPAELSFTLNTPRMSDAVFLPVQVPCFHRTTSIELNVPFLHILPPPAGEFSALETLSLTGRIVDLGALLGRCPRLRTLSVTFRGIEYSSINAALAVLAAAPTGLEVSLLDICISRQDHIGATRIPMLLHAAASVSSQEFIFAADFFNDVAPYRAIIDVDFPYVGGATSIEIKLDNICFKRLPPAGDFQLLEKLSISGCAIADLAPLVARCPRLRVLKVTAEKSTRNITVHSTSLHQLDVCIRIDTECQGIDVVAPNLKQLKLRVYASMNLSVSISAPMLEKVSFFRYYTGLSLSYGCWSPDTMKLETLPTDNNKGKCHHPVHALILHMSAYIHRSGSKMDFAQEIEKLMVTDFSQLEIHLTPFQHAFGELVLSLLGMHRIRTATQRLNLILPNWFMARKFCQSFPCGGPKNRKSDSILLPRLEDVEISGFKGEHPQLDLLKRLFGCAPILRTVTVKLAQEVEIETLQDWITKIDNVFLAHPSVKCSIYLSCGELVQLGQPCS